MTTKIFRNLKISLCCLTLLLFLSSSALQAQIVIVDGDRSPSPFPDPFAGPFFEQFQEVGPSLRSDPSKRWDVFGFGFPLFFDSGQVEGEIVLREAAFFDVIGGQIRGLTIADFSGAFIFEGEVEALDPGDGLVFIGGNAEVGLGNYSSAGGSRFESESQTLSRISPLTTPSNAVLVVDGGRLTGGLHPEVGFSLGANGAIDISGGAIDTSFGDIAGIFDVSGGEFSNFSVDSVSGEINILGTDLQFNGSSIAETVQTFDSSTAAGGSVTGNLVDGNAFEFEIPTITGDGVVNIINDVSEFEITMDNEEGAANGGAAFSGGVDVTIEDVTVDGNFESQALTTDVDDLENVISSTVAPDFELASSDAVQHWELDFSGQFINEAELFFGYDELGLDIPEEDLAVYHFDEELGIWESLDILEHDLARNRIRVRTTSFSPFVLGAASVPEPGSSVFLLGMMLTLAIRRQR